MHLIQGKTKKSLTMQSKETTIESPKLSIKQTVSQLIDIEKEVDLPYFFAGKHGFDYYKIISSEISLAVYDYPGSKVAIELRNSVNHFLPDSIEINESSFEAAKKSVLSKIQNHNL